MALGCLCFISCASARRSSGRLFRCVVHPFAIADAVLRMYALVRTHLLLSFVRVRFVRDGLLKDGAAVPGGEPQRPQQFLHWLKELSRLFGGDLRNR